MQPPQTDFPHEFVREVLALFNAFQGPFCHDLWWRMDAQYAPITFLVSCNDFFWWATGDGETPLTVFDDDRFFFSEDALLDYCADLGIELASLQLVICEPQYLRELEADEHFCDDLPEGESLKDLDRELWDAIEAVNAIIRKRKKPLSWVSGRYRTTYGKEE